VFIAYGIMGKEQGRKGCARNCLSGATTAFVLVFRACNSRVEDCRRRVEELDDEDDEVDLPTQKRVKTV